MSSLNLEPDTFEETMGHTFHVRCPVCLTYIPNIRHWSGFQFARCNDMNYYSQREGQELRPSVLQIKLTANTIHFMDHPQVINIIDGYKMNNHTVVFTKLPSIMDHSTWNAIRYSSDATKCSFHI